MLIITEHLISLTYNLDIPRFIFYMHTMLIQLFVSCRVNCILRIITRRTVMWFTQLTRHDANNCCKTFMHIIR